MRIRKAILKDTVSLISLFRDFYNESLKIYGIPLDEKTVGRTVISYVSNHIVFVLEKDDEEVVGFIGGVIATYPVNDKVKMFIESGWFVKEAYRRHSVSLLEGLEKYCKSVGIEHILIGNTDNNGKADQFKRFYEQKGYKLFEQHFIKGL
jgi:hypothetical protein